MNAESTVLIAGVVAPKTRVSMRVQITSKMSPDAPDKKKQTNGTRSASSPMDGPRGASGTDERVLTNDDLRRGKRARTLTTSRRSVLLRDEGEFAAAASPRARR